MIRQLPCLGCGKHPPNEAAHVRYGEPDRGKPPTGISEKPSDKWALPLCGTCHRTGRDSQHGSNERAWWRSRGIDPIALCDLLYGLKSVQAMEVVIILSRLTPA